MKILSRARLPIRGKMLSLEGLLQVRSTLLQHYLAVQTRDLAQK
jgi:hypothetical protein